MVAPVGPSAKADGYKQGLLGHERHGPVGAVPIIAAPGLTSHRAVWQQMIAHLPDTDVVAVDLRGRGASRDLPGPSSIGRHAVDLIDLADELGIERFVLGGHSLGAFVAVACAAEHPDRVAGLLLVDGGVTIPPPSATVDAGATAAAELQAILTRLDRTFESYEDYHDFWREHPALGPYWSDAIAGYMDADLCGHAPTLRPAANADRVMEDMADLYGAERVDPFQALRVRTVILRAERGILDQPMGLYPAGYLQAVAAQQPLVQIREVEQVNHYTILLGNRGASRVAEAVRDIIDDVS